MPPTPGAGQTQLGSFVVTNADLTGSTKPGPSPEMSWTFDSAMFIHEAWLVRGSPNPNPLQIAIPIVLTPDQAKEVEVSA